jgi:CDP-4-dehydro-6-deoxyglucose reductase
MNSVRYEGRSYPLAVGGSVLDALLAGGVAAAHSCKAGTCGSCMMRVTEGVIPQKSQSGLKDSWKTQGYFLPCVCLPDTDLSVTGVGADARCGASITGLEALSPDVLCARLACDTSFAFHAGQYVTILLGEKLARSYSIASLPAASLPAPEGREIEIHVRRIAGGRMSGWFHDTARPGDRIEVLGPSGDCFYVPGNPGQPLLLAGTGTGLAPLYGILLDALRQGHAGPIHLFHGAVSKDGLYLVNELRSLAASHSNVEYTAAVLNGSDSQDSAVGVLDQVVLNYYPKLTGWRAFVCGDPAIVKLLKKKIFLAGAASRDIYADAFLPAVLS